ncbi:MAG: hypothetical protein ACK5KL_10575 [Dysgonomonas sp.]
MKLKLYLLLCLGIFCSKHTSAQVTMGSNNPPEDFAILQLDGTSQGLRLSRLDTNQRDQLTNTLDATGKLTARGLMIFNTETGSIEFFDGADWKGLSKAPTFDNGIEKDGVTGNVILGGNLREDTEISQGTNKLNFTTTTGLFTVNTDLLQIGSTNVTASNANFSINNGTNDVFKITKTSTGSQIDAIVGTTGLNVNNGVFTAATGKVTMAGTGGKLSYTYPVASGAAGDAIKPKAGRIIFAADTKGLARWGDITPSTEIQPFNITRNQGYHGTNGTPSNQDKITSTTTEPNLTFQAITDPLTLSKGRWLIAGMVYTYTYAYATSGTANKFVWTRICRNNSGTYSPLFTTANLAELKTGTSTNANSGAYTAIQIMYILNVETAGQYRVEMTTAMPNTTMVAGWTGTSQLRAVKVSDRAASED